MIQNRVSLRCSSVIALLCAVLVFQIKPSLGGPGSVLNATDPLRSAPAIETRDIGVGDMTIRHIDWTWDSAITPEESASALANEVDAWLTTINPAQLVAV